jgi:hypothetical protein
MAKPTYDLSEYSHTDDIQYGIWRGNCEEIYEGFLFYQKRFGVVCEPFTLETFRAALSSLTSGSLQLFGTLMSNEGPIDLFVALVNTDPVAVVAQAA